MAKEIDASTWDEEIGKAEQPVVVEFWHELCGWCVKLAPIYDELAGEYDGAVLAKLNVRSSPDNAEIAGRYGVMGTPTMKVFCRGREVGELVGFMQKEQLKQGLDRIIDKSEECLRQSTPLDSA